MSGRLDGKSAIVTGAGSGIGRGIAMRLASEGARIIVADISEPDATKVANGIRVAGGEVSVGVVDVRQRAQVDSLIDQAVRTFGGLDILVNNAGVGKIVPFLETTEQDWDVMFDVNCKGLLFVSQAAGRVMIDQRRGGKIVNLASQAGRRGEALALGYCASKAAVISMTQSMALALAEHKINVNAVAPGVVDTPFWVEVDRQFARLNNLPVGEPKRRAVANIPLGRIEQPSDVAGAVAFLCSSDADYITQQTLNVDGGNWPS